MDKWLFLSYPLSPQTPSYGGGHGVVAQPGKQMAAGDSCNTQQWQMSNHIGTHVDAPRHFSAKGLTVDEYPADYWIFDYPWMLDISPVPPEVFIMPERINLGGVPTETDILLLKTGFFEFRGMDEYWQNSPGLSSQVAGVIRNYLPSVRALGLDLISVSSLSHREEGRKAHRAFLDHEKPILLLEDVDLSGVNGGTLLKQVVVAPLRVAGADGAPCSIFAKF